MGKKKTEILDEFKPYFIYGSGNAVDSHTGKPYNIKGCIANGVTEEAANIIWDKMYEFAKYAFNKSHGAAYAVIAAQTAWLAKYHPVIFMKANMNTYIGSPKKLKYYLGQCIQNGIQMLPPSINESQQKFSLNHDATGIRFGLKGVKNVGSASISILEEQKARGRFVSLQNFIERMIKYHKLNRRALEGLIYVGALDEFEGTRAAKIAFLDEMIKIVKEDKSISDGYNTIFDLADEIGVEDMVSLKDIQIPYIEEMPKDEKFAKELEFSGFYITGHPLEDYQVVLKLENVLPSSTFKTSDDDDEDDEGGNNTESSVNDYIDTKVKVAGVIAEYEKKQTRTGKPMATFKLQDMVGEVSIIAFENALKQMELADGMKVIIEGYVDQNDFGIQIKANNICELTNADVAIKNVNVYPSVVSDVSRTQYMQLNALLRSFGSGDVTITFRHKNFTKTVGRVNLTLEFFNELQKIFGEKNCRLK